MDFLTWKFLHIVTMFFAVALAVSGELVVRRVAASCDPRAIAVTTGQVKPLGNLAGGLFVVGLVFGVLAAIAGQIDLLRPWLISAYVAFAAAMAVGLTITDPWLNRLQAAAAASPQGAPSAELLAVIEDPRARVGTALLMGLVVVLVFIMVVKPFG